jgi:hypothetical protein
MVQTRGSTKTYSKEKSALQKINVLCLAGYGRDYYELLGKKKSKAVPLHTLKAHGGRGGIAPTRS